MKVAIANLFSRTDCERYPFNPKTAPAHYRGRLVFHPEGCIGCGICERVCSPQAISTTVVHEEDGDRITRVFHMGSCTFCQTCVDFCPRHTIEMSKDYDMVVTNEDDLKVMGTYFKAAKKPAPKAVEAAKPEEAAVKIETAADSAPKETPEAESAPKAE